MATLGVIIGVNLQLWPLALYSVMAACGVTFAFHNACKWTNRKEIIRFTRNDFEIQRYDQNINKPAEIIRLQAFGLSFKLSDDDAKNIYAMSKGERIEIAPFMAPEKRIQFIQVLREGHNFWKQPDHIKEAHWQNNRGKETNDTAPILSAHAANMLK